MINNINFSISLQEIPEFIHELVISFWKHERYHGFFNSFFGFDSSVYYSLVDLNQRVYVHAFTEVLYESQSFFKRLIYQVISPVLHFIFDLWSDFIHCFKKQNDDRWENRTKRLVKNFIHFRFQWLQNPLHEIRALKTNTRRNVFENNQFNYDIQLDRLTSEHISWEYRD